MRMGGIYKCMGVDAAYFPHYGLVLKRDQKFGIYSKFSGGGMVGGWAWCPHHFSSKQEVYSNIEKPELYPFEIHLQQ